jgi:hypothetical protein
VATSSRFVTPAEEQNISAANFAIVSTIKKVIAMRKNEKPILFSTSMVQAVLDGRKTQTRRTTGLKEINQDPDRYLFQRIEEGFAIFWDGNRGERLTINLPYGLPEEYLWVRETWAAGKCADTFKPSELDPKTWLVDNGGLWFEANDTLPKHPITPKGKTRPSIFLPRWASRIDLFQKKVRIERLNDISAGDAKAEGDKERSGMPEFYKHGSYCHILWFRNLWESINGQGSWALNPFVFVIEFEKVCP